MTKLAYTVHASFEDVATADAFVAWLRGGHIDAVIAGGAETALIVRLDPDSLGAGGGRGSGGGGDDGGASAAGVAARVEVRYVFRSRADYAHYVEFVAPTLRAEGLAKFGASQGVTMRRSIGEVV